MFRRTSHADAPWRIVRGNVKKIARLELIRDLLASFYYGGKSKKLANPDSSIVFPWSESVAGDQRSFRSLRTAYQAGQDYALAHGLKLLKPTPFSDTDAIGVGLDYAVQNGLSTIRDLHRVAPTLTFGAPPQFQQEQTGLPALEQAYGFAPASFKALEIGGQYQALDQGAVQAADVNTTDGQLTTGNYVLLKDPLNVLVWGNVVPVVSTQVVQAEGPAFVATINRVSALLTLQAIRQLNAAVDLSGEDPAAVAQQFLAAHGLAPASTS